MARKGLPAKYAKMGFKKGWAAYKKAKRMRGSSHARSGAAAKTVTRKTTPNRRPRTMAGPARPAKRRKLTLMSNRHINALVKGGMTGASTVGSTWAINFVPWVKDQKTWVKSLIQAAIGLAIFTFGRRKPLVQLVGVGFMSGAAVTQILPLINQKVFGRRFTPRELYELQTMGVPVQIGPGATSNRTMGVPVKIGNGNRNYFAERSSVAHSNYSY